MKFEARHLPSDLCERFLRYAEEHPKQLPPAQLLEKLIILDLALGVCAFQNKRILEVGTGTGLHTAILSHFGQVSSTELPPSEMWTGPQVEDHRAALFSTLSGSPIEFRFHDGKSLPFADESFDLVFHNSVIEHVAKPQDFLRECYRVLRPGGYSVCLTGSRLLCAHRFAKYSLRLPLRVAVGLARMSPAFRARLKLRDHVATLNARLERASASQVAPSDTFTKQDFWRSAVRIRHYLYMPDYNELVLDKLCEEFGTTKPEILARSREVLSSWSNVFAFQMLPETHGQHYANVWDEFVRWGIDEWKELLQAGGFEVVGLYGWKLDHVFDWFGSYRRNMVLHSKALGLLHQLLSAPGSPSYTTEFIAVLRKPGMA